MGEETWSVPYVYSKLKMLQLMPNVWSMHLAGGKWGSTLLAFSKFWKSLLDPP